MIKVKRGITLKDFNLSLRGKNKYFMIGDLGYGFVQGQSFYVRDISKYPDCKIFPANHDFLLLGRTGNPQTGLYKMAVVNESYDFMISDNLYCIDIEDPYYVVSYFLSSDVLKSISSVANGVPFLPIAKLKNLEIPAKTKKEKQNIEKNYKKLLNDFLKKLKVAKEAQERLKNVF